MMRIWWLSLTLTIFLVGCQTTNPIHEPTEVATIQEPEVTCQDVAQNWGQNWPLVITSLEALQIRGVSCGAEPLPSKLYAAHFSYGVQLEQAGDVAGSITQFQAAFALDPQRAEALNTLARLDALPEPTPAACPTNTPPASDPAQNVPPPTDLVTAEGQQLIWRNDPFLVRGVNYYPRYAPWHRFLTDADVAEMAAELDLITAAGFNTIRIFLWYEPLFLCEPERAIPNEETFGRLDALFALAAERDLKLIVTLNDLPDLLFRPLYTDWERYDAQTTYIVRRYRHEPHILAWDLRNEGDLDHGARGDEAMFNQEEVLNWLGHISQLVREHDPHHLLTAGWWGNPQITVPHVDVLSFHHWYDVETLQMNLAEFQTSKPLLMQEFGYHSWADAPQDVRDEETQAVLLKQMITTAEKQGIAGWLVWTAFDFVPEAGQPAVYEHHFGLWRTDLSPKPALTAVRSE